MTPSIDGQREESESFRWRVRLSDKAPQKRWGIAFAALAAAALGYGFGGPLMGAVGFAIILGSTAEFWFGSRFSVDEKGATAQIGLSMSSIEWGSVKRLIWESNGVRLSPLEKPGTMDAFRGVFLRYGDEREAIEEAVKKLGARHGSLGPGTHGGGDGHASGQSGSGDHAPEDRDACDSHAGDA